MDEIRSIGAQIFGLDSLKESSQNIIYFGPEFSLLENNEQNKLLSQAEFNKKAGTAFLFVQPDKHFAFERTNYGVSTLLTDGFYRQTFEEFLETRFKFYRFQRAQFVSFKRTRTGKLYLSLVNSKVETRNVLLVGVVSDERSAIDALWSEQKPSIFTGTKWALKRALLFGCSLLDGTKKCFLAFTDFWLQSVGRVIKIYGKVKGRIFLLVRDSELGFFRWFCLTRGAYFVFRLSSLGLVKEFKKNILVFIELINTPALARSAVGRNVLFFGLLSSHRTFTEVLVTQQRAGLIRRVSRTALLPQKTNLVGHVQREPVKSILFVSSMFPSTLHAGGLRVFDIINHLVGRGFEVSLFSLLPERHEEACWDLLKPILKNYKLVPESKFTSGNLAYWLRATGSYFDISHFEWPLAAELLNSQEKGRLGKRIFTFMEVVTRRASLDFSLLQSGGLTRLTRLAFNGRFRDAITGAYLEDVASSSADALITLTPEDSNFLKQTFGQNSEIVPTGMSPTLFGANGQTLKVNSVGFLGYYNHYPNIDGLAWYLKNVHPKVLLKFPDYSFNVFGKGSLDKIKKDFEEVKGISWVGEVEQVSDAICPMEIMVAPLISGAGFRGKVNQYSFFGKPTVSTSIGAQGLPYIDGKSILIADSPDLFAEHILSLLKSKEKATVLGEESKNLCEENFSWEKQIDKLVSLYA